MFKRRAREAEGRPRLGDRRRTKRHPAGWDSRYRVVDDSRQHTHYAGEDFEPCVLADLSTDGAGLHLTEGEVEVGDYVELDLPLGANRGASIQVRGEVRYKSADDEGTPRAGLEFVGVGDLERALLFRLVRDMHSAAAQSA